MFNIKGLELSSNNEFWFCKVGDKTLVSQYKKKCTEQQFIELVNNIFSRPYRVEEELGLEVYLLPAGIKPNGWLVVEASTKEVKTFQYTDSSMGLWKDGKLGVRSHVLCFVH